MDFRRTIPPIEKKLHGQVDAWDLFTREKIQNPNSNYSAHYWSSLFKILYRSTQHSQFHLLFVPNMTECMTDLAQAAACRNGTTAAHLKVISIFMIFVTSVTGVCAPVTLARYFQGKSLYNIAILLIKCFAAGVILATSLVHVLPDAFAALSDCQVASQHPWKDFPFAGLVIFTHLSQLWDIY